VRGLVILVLVHVLEFSGIDSEDEVIAASAAPGISWCIIIS